MVFFKQVDRLRRSGFQGRAAAAWTMAGRQGSAGARGQGRDGRKFRAGLKRSAWAPRENAAWGPAVRKGWEAARLETQEDRTKEGVCSQTKRKQPIEDQPSELWAPPGLGRDSGGH